MVDFFIEIATYKVRNKHRYIHWLWIAYYCPELEILHWIATQKYYSKVSMILQSHHFRLLSHFVRIKFMIEKRIKLPELSKSWHQSEWQSCPTFVNTAEKLISVVGSVTDWTTPMEHLSLDNVHIPVIIREIWSQGWCKCCSFLLLQMAIRYHVYHSSNIKL